MGSGERATGNAGYFIATPSDILVGCAESAGANWRMEFRSGAARRSGSAQRCTGMEWGRHFARSGRSSCN
jgi:hypothetical protein